MRETRADTAQAVVLAIGLHLLLFLLMIAGLWWDRSNPQVQAMGSPISAELVDANALSQAMQRTLAERPEPAQPEPPVVETPAEEETVPPPQPLPTPVVEDAPTPPQPEAQEFIPEPDAVDQEEVTDQPTPTPAEEQERQEAKQRQDQVDLTERKRQEEAERKRRLAEQAEAERQARLADIRRQREAAQREARLAEQKLRQIADAQARTASDSAAAAPAGQGGQDTDLAARYQAALTQAILSKWTRPETVPLGARCKLVIRQLPGGEVMSAEVSSPCAYDEQGRRSIEAAVLKAQPLPYAGFEPVFQRTLILNFEARDR
ncbi:cell envelope integrity protein TolA [Marilutibacter chinensis]|uniref:Cell envelope integrity protein TolA n=1 Tax=Marilutibacter chinensis TaxID=2912247 RepID=A0ABS9HUU0_9GAMM|nr:cell envelope integrity protein TolA [Lysobacter chinensis]MCF7221989.1 cell envelope integrity protein TolA [Lysobacter chinensis]